MRIEDTRNLAITISKILRVEIGGCEVAVRSITKEELTIADLIAVEEAT